MKWRHRRPVASGSAATPKQRKLRFSYLTLDLSRFLHISIWSSRGDELVSDARHTPQEVASLRDQGARRWSSKRWKIRSI